MKKRYLSLVLAVVLSLGQMAGAMQPVQASEISGGMEPLEQEGKEMLQEILTQEGEEEQLLQTNEPEGIGQEEYAERPLQTKELTQGNGNQAGQPTPTPMPGNRPIQLSYELEVDGLEKMKDIWPGETVTIKPVVYRYEYGKEPVAETGVQYQFEYDEGVCKIWKGETGTGEEVSVGASQEGEAFTVERIQNGTPSFSIRAILDGKELCYENVQFQEKDYNVPFVEGAMGDYEGEPYKSVIWDGENLEESDESVTFTVNTEKLGGKFGLEWILPIPGSGYTEIIYDENGTISSTYWGKLVDESAYKVSGENNNTITIDLQALVQNLEQNGYKTMENGYGLYSLNAVIKAGGRKQALKSMVIMFHEPKYTLRPIDLEKTYEMWINSPLTHKDGKVECFIRDKEYPSGLSLSLDIKELKILSQEPEDAGSDVFSIKKEGNDIVLVPESCGKAQLGYQVILPSGKEKVLTCEKKGSKR